VICKGDNLITTSNHIPVICAGSTSRVLKIG
jgi:hypothetical protein